MSYRDEQTASLARCHSLEQELTEARQALVVASQALVKAEGPGWWTRLRSWWGKTWFERLHMKDGWCKLCHGNAIFGEVPCECGTQELGVWPEGVKPPRVLTITDPEVVFGWGMPGDHE